MGRTFGGESWLEVTRRDGSVVRDGASSQDGRIWGCYLHGLFANDAFRRGWLNSLAQAHVFNDQIRTPAERLEAELNRLADGVEAAIDVPGLEQIIWNQQEPHYVG